MLILQLIYFVFVWKLRFFFFFSPTGGKILQQHHKEWLFHTLLFHLSSETNHQHDGNILMQPKVTAQLWNTSPDKRLVALGLSLKEHQQGADQTSAALVFRSSTHLRSRSSSCEHRAGNSLHIPSLGLHQAQLGSTHRGNCKMQIKGTTALTAFHWARPC